MSGRYFMKRDVHRPLFNRLLRSVLTVCSAISRVATVKASIEPKILEMIATASGSQIGVVDRTYPFCEVKG